MIFWIKTYFMAMSHGPGINRCIDTHNIRKYSEQSHVLGLQWYSVLTNWCRVTHICISKLTIIGSDNGLSPDGCEAIIWTNARIMLIRTLGTNVSEIFSEIHKFSLTKMHLKMSSEKWRPLCLGLNVLILDWTRCYGSPRQWVYIPN